MFFFLAVGVISDGGEMMSRVEEGEVELGGGKGVRGKGG